MFIVRKGIKWIKKINTKSYCTVKISVRIKLDKLLPKHIMGSTLTSVLKWTLAHDQQSSENACKTTMFFYTVVTVTWCFAMPYQILTTIMYENVLGSSDIVPKFRMLYAYHQSLKTLNRLYIPMMDKVAAQSYAFQYYLRLFLISEL